MKSSADKVDYTKLQLADQDTITLPWENDTDFAVDSVSITHGLGYTPIALVYCSENHSFTAATFGGFQIPKTTYSDTMDGGAFIAPYADIYFTVDFEFLTITRQSMIQANADDGELFFKYYLFAQPASA